jgi:hypothetical protein
MADPKQLAQMLAGDPRLGALAGLCDEFSAEERILAVRALGPGELAKLYARAENPDARASLAQLVPADAPPHAAVAWEGRNSLPTFNLFAKVFTRFGAPPDALLGYNRSGGFLEWTVGPGYFTCHIRPDRAHELLVDYTREPAEGLPGWPKLRKNASGLSRMVYYNGHDFLRPVGQHVMIGADYDAVTGKPRGHYFVLARGATQLLQQPAPAEAPTSSPTP